MIPGSAIIHGDCLRVMADFPDVQFDALITDPPYGYSFMGKDWDRAVPSVEVWRECLRVLKPGAFAFVMSAPRIDVLSQMGVRLAEAGFVTAFTPIFWTYASGFPKATDVSKLVDKRAGAERKVLGRATGAQADSTGCYGAWGNDNGDGQSEYDITAPATPEAAALSGAYCGYQPKPAVEVVIVAMKPLGEATYVDQALANGKGVTWLDDARVPCEETTGWGGKPGFENTHGGGLDQERDPADYERTDGRFPANLICSDDALNDGVMRYGSGEYVRGPVDAESVFGIGTDRGGSHYADSGSYSRFFDLDVWSDAQMAELPDAIRRVYPFMPVPKASKGEKDEGIDDGEPVYMDETRNDKDAIGCNNPRNRSGTARIRNHHPTVKPLTLMRYLVTLSTRPGDVVLEPYGGSGTTALAAKMLGRECICIEREAEYVAIAQARLDTLQPTLF